jgi:hypothetical protein
MIPRKWKDVRLPRQFKLPGGYRVIIRQMDARTAKTEYGRGDMRSWRGSMRAPHNSASGQFEIHILKSLPGRMKLKLRVFAHEMIHVMADFDTIVR